jgi:hypothetical protein
LQKNSGANSWGAKRVSLCHLQIFAQGGASTAGIWQYLRDIHFWA